MDKGRINLKIKKHIERFLYNCPLLIMYEQDSARSPKGEFK
jgi:hypothetical protein